MVKIKLCIFLYSLEYTLCLKKVYPLTFDNNFGKCGPIFKIISPIDSYEHSLCTQHKDFHNTFNVLLHYLVKVENPKILLILTASSTNCLHVPEDTLRT